MSEQESLTRISMLEIALDDMNEKIIQLQIELAPILKERFRHKERAANTIGENGMSLSSNDGLTFKERLAKMKESK